MATGSGKDHSTTRPLEDSDAGADEIIDAWSPAACGSAPVTIWPGRVAGELGTTCELPVTGTRPQKIVRIGAYESENALKTMMATRHCEGGYL
jgi:hypothetical protein